MPGVESRRKCRRSVPTKYLPTWNRGSTLWQHVVLGTHSQVGDSPLRRGSRLSGEGRSAVAQQRVLHAVHATGCRHASFFVQDDTTHHSTTRPAVLPMSDDARGRRVTSQTPCKTPHRQPPQLVKLQTTTTASSCDDGSHAALGMRVGLILLKVCVNRRSCAKHISGAHVLCSTAYYGRTPGSVSMGSPGSGVPLGFGLFSGRVKWEIEDLQNPILQNPCSQATSLLT